MGEDRPKRPLSRGVTSYTTFEHQAPPALGGSQVCGGAIGHMCEAAV
jgi:hypothetical protein